MIAGAGAAERVEPVGTWNCLVFGHPSRGDERMLLRLDPNGDAHVAEVSSVTGTEWRLLSGWQARRDQLTFSNFETGREFEADLSHPTLGGRWRDLRRSGGWWCLAVDRSERSGSYAMPPLIPHIMATPWYPRQAIRLAQEGTAVACFTVDSDGLISDPALIELSDEIFRNPTLSALQRSRYAEWDSAVAVPARPGCRSFTFELESIFPSRSSDADPRADAGR